MSSCRRHVAPILLTLLSLWLALPLAAQGKADKRLEEAVKLLRQNGEPEIRRGAALCAEIDTLDSIEPLLEILDSDQPHRRDIVWESLPSFRDPKARARVATELSKNKRNERARQWCAQLLGLYGDASAIDELVKALGDKQAPVRAASAQALGRIGDPAGVKALGKLVDDDDPAVRAYVLEALATLDPAAHAQTLRAGLADPDAGVRCFLLGAVPELLAEEVQALSAAALVDADWRVRLQAAQNLGLQRSRESVEALIGAAGDARPIVASAVRASLAKLTGQGWNKPEQWKKWWEGEREAFDPAVPPPPKPVVPEEERTVTVRYNDLPVESDHVAFLVDVSGEMKARLKSAEGTKGEAAYTELSRVLGLLEGRLVFNVYAYDTLAPAFTEGPVALDARTAKKALAFVADAHPRGAKDIWNALLTALSDTELDTIYLLASGEPEIGLYVHHNRVTEHLRELQRFHKVVVHGVAYTESDWYADQIEEICKATGGEFRHVK